MNVHSLHNYQHITATLPHDLRHSTFAVDDEQYLRKKAAEQIRNKKAQQSLATQDLLLAQMQHISQGGAAEEEGDPSSRNLIQSLESDRELMGMISNVWGGDAAERSGAETSNQPSGSTQVSNTHNTAQYVSISVWL